MAPKSSRPQGSADPASNRQPASALPALDEARELLVPIAFVGLELLEGSKYPMQKAAELISQYALSVVIDIITRMGLLLEKATGPRDVETQRGLLHRTCSKTMLALIESKAREIDRQHASVFFHEAQLLCALKLALEHSVGGPEHSDQLDLDDLFRALLVINDNIDLGVGEKSEPDRFLRSFFPSMVLTHRGSWEYRAARWECLLNEIPRRLSGDPSFDYQQAFRDATGVGMDEYRAYALLLIAAYMHILETRDVDKQDISFTHDALLGSWETGDVGRQLKPLLWGEAGRLREEFVDAGALASQPYYLLPLISRPVVEANGKAWIPSKHLLTEKLAAGLYHEIFTYLQDHVTPDGLQRFFDFRGRVFEEYVADLLTRAYPAGGPCRCIRLPKPAKGEGRRCDFAIVENRRAVLVECKSRLFSLHAFAAGDLEAIKSEYEKLVMDAADQIDQTVAGIENDDLAIVAIRPWDIDVYLPLTCTLEFVPCEYASYDYVSRLIEKRNLLAHRKCNRPQFVDIGTMEMLEPYLADGSHQLSDLLVEKNLDASLRPMSFWNYVRGRGLTERPNEYLLSVGRRLTAFAHGFWQAHEKPRSLGDTGIPGA